MESWDFSPVEVARALEAASIRKPRRVRLYNPQGQMKYAREYVIEVPGKGPVEICQWLDGSGWWFQRLPDGGEALQRALAEYKAKR